MTALYDITLLGERHDRDKFRSGNEALDRYIRIQAGQDQRRRVSACFVATPIGAPGVVAGYYTLAAATIVLGDLPETLAKKLPRYPALPAARIGRLAVDRTTRGKGLGGALLADALARSLRSEVAVYAAVVDAKDDEAVAFYRHHGFAAFASRPRALFLPLSTIAALSKP